MRYVFLFVLMLLAAMLLVVPEAGIGLYNSMLHMEGRTLIIPLYASTPLAIAGLVMLCVLTHCLSHRSPKQALVGGAALILLSVPATVYAWSYGHLLIPNLPSALLPQRPLNLAEHEHLIAMAVLGFVLFCWNCDSVTRTWRAEEAEEKALKARLEAKPVAAKK